MITAPSGSGVPGVACGEHAVNGGFEGARFPASPSPADPTLPLLQGGSIIFSF